MRASLAGKVFRAFSGQGLAEYALLAAVLAVGAIGAYAAFQDECDEALRRIMLAVSLPFPM